MTKRYQYIFPGSFELISLLFVTGLVIFLGNSRQLLEYYGLTSSSAVLKQGAGDTVSHGLTQLDNFSVTRTLVTFLIWAVVGLLCFSIAQAISRGYHEFQLEEQLSSNRYIHPSSFSRRRFWEHVALGFFGSIIGLVVLGLGLYGFFGYALPIGLTYTRYFLQGISLSHAPYFLLGFAVLYVALIALDCCTRLLVRHQKIFS